MPVYAYKCKNCGRHFDVKQRFSEEPLSDCPHCEDGQVRRVISNVGIVFKGSGFYVTDNRNGRGSVGVNGSGKSKLETSASDEKPKATSKSEGSSKRSTSDSTSAGTTA